MLVETIINFLQLCTCAAWPGKIKIFKEKKAGNNLLFARWGSFGIHLIPRRVLFKLSFLYTPCICAVCICSRVRGKHSGYPDRESMKTQIIKTVHQIKDRTYPARPSYRLQVQEDSDSGYTMWTKRVKMRTKTLMRPDFNASCSQFNSM